MFTARYAFSPYITQIGLVLKGLQYNYIGLILLPNQKWKIGNSQFQFLNYKTTVCVHYLYTFYLELFGFLLRECLTTEYDDKEFVRSVATPFRNGGPDINKISFFLS